MRSKTQKKRQSRLPLLSILLLTAVAFVIDLPTFNYNFTLFNQTYQGSIGGPDIRINVPFSDNIIRKELKIFKGLDLEGGIQLTYQADMSQVDLGDRSDRIQRLVDKIDGRINTLGVTEPRIHTSQIGDQYRAIVEIPGVSNVEEAKSLIGKTAELEMKEVVLENVEVPAVDENSDPQYFQTESYGPAILTGNDIKDSGYGVDEQSGKYMVTIDFESDAADTFYELSKRLYKSGGLFAILIDGEEISRASFENPIPGGSAQISGSFTLEEAKQLSIQLQEGALPVPVELVAEKHISPSLGAESIRKSLIAGIIGLVAVALIMILYYRLPGVVAVFALGLYSMYTVALFKLIPVTLTLSGIAAFVLSIGMAVDANILIFERFKEEVRSGKKLNTAMQVGFARAWSSIRDSNVSSLITASILFYFGTGTIRGFAVTLSLGVLVSMFTAITISRLTMFWFVRQERFQKLSYYGLSEDKQ